MIRTTTILTTLVLVLLVFSCGQSQDTGGSGNNKQSAGQQDQGQQQQEVTQKIEKQAQEAKSQQRSGQQAQRPQNQVIEQLPQAPSAKSSDRPPEMSQMSSAQGNPYEEFLSLVLQYLDAFWSQQFAQTTAPYYTPQLFVLYNEAAPSQCQPGQISPNSGAVYCAPDMALYIPAYHRVASTGVRYDQHGDFALAYVMAHEFSHHVQNLSGLTPTMFNTRDGYELQADCLAGVWANATYYVGVLEGGDLEEAEYLAKALGDDSLGVQDAEQRIHGPGDNRISWFSYGYDTGDPTQCWPPPQAQV
jgi:predicted metalloprotease